MFGILILTFHFSVILISGQHPCSTTPIDCRVSDDELNCGFATSDASVISSLIKQCSENANNFQSQSFTWINFNIAQTVSSGNISLDIHENISTVRVMYESTATMNCLVVVWTRIHQFISRLYLQASSCIYVIQTNFLDYLPNLNILWLSKIRFDSLFLALGHDSLVSMFITDLNLPSPVPINSSTASWFPQLDQLELRETNEHWYSLNSDTFDLFPNITYLYIGQFQDRIFTNQFIQLTKLATLQAALTVSTTIEYDAFAGLDSLTSLTFQNTINLERLNDTTFLSLVAMRFISCGLTSLDSRFFQQQPQLQMISAFGANPFHCDCELQWTSIASQMYNLMIIGNCDTPSTVNGQPITTSSIYQSCVQNESFHCFNQSFHCSDNMECVNTADSAFCRCREGYQLSVDQCLLDICAVDNGGCQQVCSVNNCSCNEGYILDADMRSCLDVNECTEMLDNCSQICINTNGSYQCECQPGFNMTTTGNCSDIDECTEMLDNCSQICINTNGSYQCECQPGFNMTATGNCSDIDECTEMLDNCSQICINTNGSYLCECQPGFNMTTTGNCSDIDECTEMLDNCSQICINTNGSYQCECQPGFNMTTTGNCSDIDECLTNNGGCNQTCLNTNGSSYCSCYLGYSLDADLKVCLVIDECLPINPCQHDCIDRNSSYICLCRNGYNLTNTTKCTDIDECGINNGACNHVCINTMGSHMCSCYNGYELDSDLLNCRDINECLTNTHGCQELCVNSNGSYDCQLLPTIDRITLLLPITITATLLISACVLLCFTRCCCCIFCRINQNNLSKPRKQSTQTKSSILDSNSEDPEDIFIPNPIYSYKVI